MIKQFIEKLVGFYKKIIRKTFMILPGFLKIVFAKKIKNFKSENINQVVNYSINALGGTIRPLQIPEEFEKFLQIFLEQKPKIILEIGTENGGSLFSLCKLAQEDAIIISMDLPGGQFGGGYPEWRTPIYQLFKKEKQQLILLREDSHSEKTTIKIKNILNGKQIDFLFIDGDHTYDGVKKDFEMYSPSVKKGGVIAFHDVTPNGLEKYTGGVPIFWKEIKNKYVYKEFIKDLNQTGFGIGCLFYA